MQEIRNNPDQAPGLQRIHDDEMARTGHAPGTLAYIPAGADEPIGVARQPNPPPGKRVVEGLGGTYAFEDEPPLPPAENPPLRTGRPPRAPKAPDAGFGEAE